MEANVPPPDRILEIVSVNSRDGLSDCLKQLQQGPWRFLQLRGHPIGDSAIDDDDVDLLGSRESVDRLLDAALGWMRAGKCHLRVTAKKSDKVELTLFSLDGQHQAQFDLWIRLAQFDRGRRQISSDDCASHRVDPQAAIARLPVDLEACVYLQHLICKRKDLASQSVQDRLTSYGDGCRAVGQRDLAALLEQVGSDMQISPAAEQFTLSRLDSTLCLKRCRSSVRSVLHRFRQTWLSPPRTTSMISIMGCDGAGKTTLAERLAEQSPETLRTFTGKHLYRKSLSYKLAVIFLRPFITRSRERFDEILAPWLYLRACLALSWKLLFHKRRTLVDRSLVDFLYVDRKTDRPAFCRSSWLIGWIGRRIPTVHCHVSFENVVRRKQEMTAAGHSAYDRDMFDHFTRRVPTDYVAFNNDGLLSESLPALSKIIASLSGARDESHARDNEVDRCESPPMEKRKESKNGGVSGAAA